MGQEGQGDEASVGIWDGLRMSLGYRTVQGEGWNMDIWHQGTYTARKVEFPILRIRKFCRKCDIFTRG